ncbi:MAG: M23 family metallopeptidase [Firmicutes bacterium]|nr:M23 family metallopeptidase [Bacillota bacterium]
MKTKDKFITFILCTIVLCIYVVANSYSLIDKKINRVYKVYLDGEVIGTIENKDDLYSLIDEKQQSIKDKYDVENVYPPNGLEVIETYSYNANISSINDIYNKIEELQDFTIFGYEVKVSATTDHESYSIYILDKEIFNKAIKDFILAFIDEEGYNNYINATQGELEDVGITYNEMGFLENIVIKEKYISINDKIYENSDELAQDLLFGFDYKERSYTVKAGDTIESVAEDFELNPQEILIANSKYSSKDSLLTIGDKLMIAYVLPELSFSYKVQEMEEEEQDYNNEIVRDNTKPSGYSEITTPGVKGLNLVTKEYTVVNGELASTVEIINQEVIREKVDQVTTKGKKAVSLGWEIFQDTGSGWTWPTIDRYVITSAFGYRELGGGKQHNGIDISGTPWGSNIYAANDGIVTYIYNGCPNNGSYPNSCGGGYGNQVVIYHDNNIYTIYAHMMNDIPVSVGQTVSKKQVIGHMGNSGQSTGTHLHFGVSTGDPRKGGKFYNPRKLYQ